MGITRSQWNEEQTADLLAYLDHYVKKRSGIGNWTDELVLSKTAEHLKARTLNQIKIKLVSVLREYHGSTSNHTTRNLLRRGTRCLLALPHSLKTLIQTRQVVIELEEQKKSSIVVQTLRSGKRRSTSRSCSTDPISSSHPKKTVLSRLRNRPDSTSTQRNSTQRSTSSLSKVLHHIEKQVSPDAEGSCIEVKVRSTRIKDERTSFTDTKAWATGHLGSTSLFDISAAAPGEIPDSIQSTPDIESDSLIGTATSNLVLTVSEGQSSQESDSSLQAKTEIPKPHVPDEWSKHDSYYRQRCLSLEREIADLDKRNGVLYQLLQASECSQSTQALIVSLNGSLKDQSRKLDSLEFLHHFFRSSTSSLRALDNDKVKLTFQNLQASFAELGKLKRWTCDLEDLFQPQSEILQSLINRSLGHDRDWASSDPDTSTFPSGIPSSTLLLSIVGAATCEWVFWTDLDSILMLSSPLLEQYREHLLTLGGRENLHSIELAARKSLLGDKSFEAIHTRPAANRLTERMLSILPDRLLKTKCLRRKLQKVFSNALMLKYEIMPCRGQFHTIWPARGSVFSDQLMTAYWKEAEDRVVLPEESQISKVRLAIIPGFQYTADAVTLVSNNIAFGTVMHEEKGSEAIFCALVIAE